MQTQEFRSGALWGASATAVAVGLFFGRDRNWALVGLGALGVYMAKGGNLSASSIPDKLPNLPGLEKVRQLFPQQAMPAQSAFDSFNRQFSAT